MNLQPEVEEVGVAPRFQWTYPYANPPKPSRRLRSVWYVALPLTSAHRGSHSGGGALIEGAGDQARYLNEGTVYPHASLVEMITYQARCFPEIEWRYIDISHTGWAETREMLAEGPPDVLAISTYTATAPWAYIVAAEAKRISPSTVVIMGNDHAGILHREILTGRYGGRIVDFVSTGNNGPFTMSGLLSFLQGQLELSRVPSIAYRSADGVVNQQAPTFPLSRRTLPDYSLLTDVLTRSYDRAFALWYGNHYTLQRMITLPLDGGCQWGKARADAAGTARFRA